MLSNETIKLQATAVDKADAIRQAGQLLVQGGCVVPAYVDGMLAREETMSTYLGNGVAIPHGQFDDLSQVQKTCISVLQIPAGVEWEDGEMAYLIIGIAATSDEHINILSNLAEAIEDPDTAEKLAQTQDVNVILDYLNRPVSQD